MNQLLIDKQIKDIKVNSTLYICIRETRYKDEFEPKIDIRLKVDSSDMKYLTKRGFRIPKKILPELITGLTMAIETRNEEDRTET